MFLDLGDEILYIEVFSNVYLEILAGEIKGLSGID